MKQIWSVQKTFNFINSHGINLPKNAMCINNFGWWEFLINQNEKPTITILKNIQQVAFKLQYYRDNLFDKNPVKITSGWRSLNYNKKIGGAKKSYHISGLAADFLVRGISPKEVQKVLNKKHFGGLEFANEWTHIDLRGYKARFYP